MDKKQPDLPIINQANLDKELTKNSNKLLRELLKIFIVETPIIQQEINQAFHKQQQKELNNLFHKLYSSCVYCGLDKLKESLLTMRRAISSKNYSPKLLEELNKEINAALGAAKKI